VKKKGKEVKVIVRIIKEIKNMIISMINIQKSTLKSMIKSIIFPLLISIFLGEETIQKVAQFLNLANLNLPLKIN
jgi:hypothetical protein